MTPGEGCEKYPPYKNFKEDIAMLYRTLKRMIERGQTDGIESKMDIFFAAGKLTESEYTELLGMLK